jgi:hypothetical protein
MPVARLSTAATVAAAASSMWIHDQIPPEPTTGIFRSRMSSTSGSEAPGP